MSIINKKRKEFIPSFFENLKAMEYFKFIFFLIIGYLWMFSNNGNAQEIDIKKSITEQFIQLNQNSSSLLLENNDKIKDYTQSQDSFVLLNQTGNSNQVLIKTGHEDSQTVNQYGKNNSYNFINYYNSTSSNFNILQKGNSNSLHIYGENSLINNMSIIQKSNNKTITITNF